MKRTQILVCLFIALGEITMAQDITTANLRWKTIKSLEISGSPSVGDTTTLTTFGNKKVEWKDAHGTLLYSFQVVGTKGIWPDIGKAGDVSFRITTTGNSGMITFKTSGSNTKVRITLVAGNRLQTFELSAVSYEVLK